MQRQITKAERAGELSGYASPPAMDGIRDCPFPVEARERFFAKVSSGEIDMASPIARSFVAKCYERDLMGFARRFLPDHFRDSPPAFHAEIAALLLDERRLAVAAPRGHAKSTVVSFAYVLFAALMQKKRSIVIVSSSEDMAVRFLRRVRDEVEGNVRLRVLFENQRTEKWSETELRFSSGATIHAKGRGAQLRGLVDGSSRPDLIILDDIEDEELVRSDLRRAALEQWVSGTVLPTLEPRTGQLVVVGTVLHESSLLARFLDASAYPDFVTRRYAALLDDGGSLWPARFDEAALKKIKDGYSSRGQLTQFYLEYQNNPIPQESAAFRQSEFHFFEKLPDDKLMYSEAFCDLGGGSVRKTADPTALGVVYVDSRNDLWLEDYVNVAYGTDLKAFFDDLFKLHFRHKFRRLVMERTQAANMVRAALEAEMLRRRVFFEVEYVSPTRGDGTQRGNMSDGKYQRIAAMAMPVRLGVIHIRKWMSDLQEQLVAFPRAAHDDLADMLSYAWMLVQRRLQRPEKEDAVNDPLGLRRSSRDPGEYVPMYDEIGV